MCSPTRTWRIKSHRRAAGVRTPHGKRRRNSRQELENPSVTASAGAPEKYRVAWRRSLHRVLDREASSAARGIDPQEEIGRWQRGADAAKAA